MITFLFWGTPQDWSELRRRCHRRNCYSVPLRSKYLLPSRGCNLKYAKADRWYATPQQLEIDQVGRNAVAGGCKTAFSDVILCVTPARSAVYCRCMVPEFGLSE